ncbi:hypothetical protein EI94DRAFT_1836099 [Lactarius quietus]|nr:hypothetical protein EI94DRAFT_1836099 [Lactarius quietus]
MAVTFAVPALLPEHSYTGPSGIDDGDLCKCNTVLYNLISACDACQGESWINYSLWTSNCSTKATPGTFPEPVPDGTRVPKWAYFDSSIGDSWNLTEAEAIGDSPEVTGTASFIAISTSTFSRSTLPPSASVPGSSSTLTSHSSSDVDAIAGGVVGGIVIAALIAGFVLRFVIRRRRLRYAPSATDTSHEWSEMELPVPYPLTIQPRLYDPSDPMTYPSKEYLPLSNQPFDSTSNLQSSDVRYTGLPEV